MIYKTSICATWVYIRYISEKQYKILFLRCICVLMDCSILHMQFIEDNPVSLFCFSRSILHMQFIECPVLVLKMMLRSILHMQFIETFVRHHKYDCGSILHMQFIEHESW